MKRSKLFLGATTCILAIAGIAATKAARLTSLVTRYICTGAETKSCVPLRLDCGNTGSAICKTLAITGQLPYTVFSNGNKTSSVPCDDTHCSNPVPYTAD